MAYGESNGHVTRKVELVTPIRLEYNVYISKNSWRWYYSATIANC